MYCTYVHMPLCTCLSCHRYTCVLPTACVSVHIHRMCAQTVCTCTYERMLMHCFHSHRKCSLHLRVYIHSLCMWAYAWHATSVCPHPSANHKVSLTTCKVPLPRVHVRRKIIRGESLQLQKLEFLVCRTHPLQHAISNSYGMALWKIVLTGETSAVNVIQTVEVLYCTIHNTR